MSGESGGRRKRRLFTFWRVTAVIALGLAAWALFFDGDGMERGPYVARHDVAGLIVSDPERAALLRALADDPDARALMVRIDSPGGTTTGSEELFEALRDVAARKPVVAMLGEVAASGGYIAAIAADHVVAYGNTLTGSIGVISQSPDVSGLLEMLGVEMRERRSSVFKAAPSPFSETPPEVEAWEAALIADAYGWFRGLVAERRGLSGPALDEVADGRVFTGRLALAAGLVDELGGAPAARDWLTAQGIDPALPVRERAVPEEDRGLLMELISARLPDGAALGLERAPFGRRLYSLLD